ncbi:MAG: signal recognition particle receptor subunit alpha [Candidatus Micrarchaeota archaeon]|nr:signal recognition particle receptor subunit alpha [Candidatus Micrarchaeota archaeon]MDE1859860.1 signal recognition particle receptor subunit alpha [Candidatus Micrarchaeota archaeon]
MDLGEGLRKAIARLSGASVIDSKTIKEFNKELQKALISADVEVELVFALTKKIEEAAAGSEMPQGVSKRDYITNMVYEELSRLMGTSYEPEIKPKRILLAGIYGSGKTTTAAKLAKFYQDRGLGVGLICCDVSRPAAYEQLETLAKQAGAGFFGMKWEKDVRKIVKAGMQELRGKKVIICDSSGRSGMDRELIDELKAINAEFKPDERLLVINADIGQVAGRQAREFDNAIRLTGVIVTKLDGSGKGGGALSAVAAANTNVMFIGTGEKLGMIELYDSKKFVGRLLGIPDLESLIANVQEAIKSSGLREEDVSMDELTFDAFYNQMKAMSKMGPMKNVLGMMGLADVPKEALETGETKLKKFENIISSMTKEERRSEKLLREHGRIARIARGSGTTEKDVRELITDFNKMKKMADLMKNDRMMKKQLSKFMPGMGK